jgi:hypothetical protein
MLGVGMRKTKALTVKMETVKLNNKGGCNLTCLCIKYMKVIVKYFFLSGLFFFLRGGVHLRFG